MKLEKSKVIEVLNDYKEKGLITDWDVSDFAYWNCIPYIVLKDKKVFLCSTYFAYGSLNIRTIYNYETIESVQNMLNTVLEYSEIFNRVSIVSYGELKDVISNIKDFEKEYNISRKEAIDKTIEFLIGR